MWRLNAARGCSLALVTLWISVAWLVVARVGVGDEAESEKEKSEELRNGVVRVAKGFKLYLGADSVPLEMQQEAVLRWPNSTRNTREGATFVWTIDGRPEAIACVWENGGRFFSYAFHSLSRSKLKAEYEGRTVWQTAKAGLEFSTFPKAPQPADSSVKRLGQMKELARRFSCRLIGNDGKPEELRLLPRPVFRYKTDRKDLVDGALFAFAQGTDPEMILVLEAAGRDGEFEWRYAITRRTMVALDADLDGKPIWAVPLSAGANGDIWYCGSATMTN